MELKKNFAAYIIDKAHFLSEMHKHFSMFGSIFE